MDTAGNLIHFGALTKADQRHKSISKKSKKGEKRETPMEHTQSKAVNYCACLSYTLISDIRSSRNHVLNLLRRLWKI